MTTVALCLLIPRSSIARRSGALYDSVSFVVPQRRCGVFTVPLGAGVRTCVQSSQYFVRQFHMKRWTSLTILSADLEITVPMLVQVDKLVQLIESPVFTCKMLSLSSRLGAEDDSFPI
jgi:hypothetical protein